MSSDSWAKGLVSGAWRALTGRRRERGGGPRRRRSRRGHGPAESVPAEAESHDVSGHVSSTAAHKAGPALAASGAPTSPVAHGGKRAARAVAPPSVPAAGHRDAHVTPPRVPRAANESHARGSHQLRQHAAWAPPAPPGGSRLHVQVSQPQPITKKASGGSGEHGVADDAPAGATDFAHFKDAAHARHLFASRSGSSSFSGAESPLFGAVTPAHAMLHEFGRVPESGESRFSTPHAASPAGDTAMFGAAGAALYATPHGATHHTPTGALRRPRVQVGVDIVAGAGSADDGAGAGAGAGATVAAGAESSGTGAELPAPPKSDVVWPHRVLLLRARAIAEALALDLWPTPEAVEAAAARRARHAQLATRPARVWVVLAPSA